MAGFALEDLARRLKGRVLGDPRLQVRGVAPLGAAGPHDLSFLANRRYLHEARNSRAGAILVAEGTDLPGRTLLVVPDPYAGLAAALDLFHPAERPRPGVSPRSIVAASSTVGEGASVQAGAVLGERCRLGARAVVMAGAVLGDDVSVGEDTTIHPNVIIYPRCVLGSRVIVHAGTVIGSDGFGFAREGEAHRKIPQVGNVVIGDDVEIGANVAIDRGTFGSTVIGRGTKIDNLVQIGHNVQVGENSILVAQAGISGSTRLGRGVIFAGQSGAAGHLTIGDGARVGAKSAVVQDVPPGGFVIGHPAIEAGAWRRAAVLFARLPELRRRLLRLEGAAPAEAEKEE
ncbi:MAG TPA: UDP-3-O-(3-hydroxymyristoyl)glucosamine N-acyltransferase [Candidatus Polarisedimenticolia bacterium]|nr:UDP-3-O-(3-hydroxymyristoyl)glucosamine N-acyltransferase [Candidatus Polarisedimenticolia bacterium]